jgi:HAD superfamily hydrolase (TIGR01509 family)
LFEAVIFDWDGTLADTRQVILNAFHQALQVIAGLDVDDNFIERRIGVGASETFKEILTENRIEFGTSLIKKLVNEKIRIQVEQSELVRLFLGAETILESLAGKLKVGLASMNNRQVIENMIRLLDIQRFFDVVISGDDVSKSKPDPEIFLRVATRLNRPSEKCVVVEDSIFGVKAAKNANMACIAIAQGAYSTIELQNACADLVVGSLKDKKILKFILG